MKMRNQRAIVASAIDNRSRAMIPLGGPSQNDPPPEAFDDRPHQEKDFDLRIKIVNALWNPISGIIVKNWGHEIGVTNSNGELLVKIVGGLPSITLIDPNNIYEPILDPLDLSDTSPDFTSPASSTQSPGGVDSGVVNGETGVGGSSSGGEIPPFGSSSGGTTPIAGSSSGGSSPADLGYGLSRRMTVIMSDGNTYIDVNVTDQNTGVALPDIQINVYQLAQHVTRVDTDQNGSAQINFEGDIADLRISGWGYETKYISVNSSLTLINLDIALDDATEVDVTVTDERTGIPLPGVVIDVYNQPGQGQQAQIIKQGVTNQNGYTRIKFTDDAVVLRPNIRKYYDDAIRVDASRNLVSVNFELRELKLLTLTLRDQDTNEPIEDVRITIVDQNIGGERFTDAWGNAFVAFSESYRNLKFEHYKYYDFVRTFSADSTETIYLQPRLPIPYTVKAVVRDNQGNIPESAEMSSIDEQKWPFGWARSNADGIIWLKVIGDDVWLEIESPGYWISYEKFQDPWDGSTVEWPVVLKKIDEGRSRGDETYKERYMNINIDLSEELKEKEPDFTIPAWIELFVGKDTNNRPYRSKEYEFETNVSKTFKDQLMNTSGLTVRIRFPKDPDLKKVDLINENTPFLEESEEFFIPFIPQDELEDYTANIIVEPPLKRQIRIFFLDCRDPISNPTLNIEGDLEIIHGYIDDEKYFTLTGEDYYLPVYGKEVELVLVFRDESGSRKKIPKTFTFSQLVNDCYLGLGGLETLNWGINFFKGKYNVYITLNTTDGYPCPKGSVKVINTTGNNYVLCERGKAVIEVEGESTILVENLFGGWDYVDKKLIYVFPTMFCESQMLDVEMKPGPPYQLEVDVRDVYGDPPKEKVELQIVSTPEGRDWNKDHGIVASQDENGIIRTLLVGNPKFNLISSQEETELVTVEDPGDGSTISYRVYFSSYSYRLCIFFYDERGRPPPECFVYLFYYGPLYNPKSDPIKTVFSDSNGMCEMYIVGDALLKYWLNYPEGVEEDRIELEAEFDEDRHHSRALSFQIPCPSLPYYSITADVRDEDGYPPPVGSVKMSISEGVTPEGVIDAFSNEDGFVSLDVIGDVFLDFECDLINEQRRINVKDKWKKEVEIQQPFTIYKNIDIYIFLRLEDANIRHYSQYFRIKFKDIKQNTYNLFFFGEYETLNGREYARLSTQRRGPQLVVLQYLNESGRWSEALQRNLSGIEETWYKEIKFETNLPSEIAREE